MAHHPNGNSCLASNTACDDKPKPSKNSSTTTVFTNAGCGSNGIHIQCNLWASLEKGQTWKNKVRKANETGTQSKPDTGKCHLNRYCGDSLTQNKRGINASNVSTDNTKSGSVITSNKEQTR